MRKLLIFTAACLMACAAWAGEPQTKVLSLTTQSPGTNSISVGTFVNGYIDSITFDVVTAGTTGTLSVVAESIVSTVADVTLATKTDCASDLLVLPRRDGTGTGGSALTNDPPWRYAVAGEVTFTCVNANTSNVTFKAVIVHD